MMEDIYIYVMAMLIFYTGFAFGWIGCAHFIADPILDRWNETTDTLNTCLDGWNETLTTCGSYVDNTSVYYGTLGPNVIGGE